jgi:putative transposase
MCAKTQRTLVRPWRARHRQAMARPPRDDAPGIFHVTVRGVGPGPLYLDAFDPFFWHADFATTLLRVPWTCMAVCLLTTHVHLLIDVPDSSLSAGMHRINSVYARALNRRHERSGPLQEQRFHSTRIESDAHLALAFRYIARNPVDAHLCISPLDWGWSSYRSAVGLEDGFTYLDIFRIVGLFGRGPRALARLRTFVESGR